MAGIKEFVKRSGRYEVSEDRKVRELREEVEEGEIKNVWRGLHQDIQKEVDGDEEILRIFEDMRPSPRAVNTWKYTHRGKEIIKQDELPKDFYTAMLDHGLDHVIEEAVKIFEDFADRGYVYCDLSPENIRFLNEHGAAVDYLDQEAVEPLEQYNIEIAAAMSYDLFTHELTSSVPGLEREEVEEKISKYSSHVDTGSYTGEVLTDFLD